VRALKYQVTRSLSSPGRKSAKRYEDAPKVNAILCVDIQHANRDAAALGPTDKPRSNPTKMALPRLPARVKQRDHLTLVPAGQIGAFSQIAALATPRKIAWMIGAAVLARDNVFKLE
jgi:hypothetical protein